MKKFAYYEDGRKKVVTMRKAYRMFSVVVDEEQKSQGTDFPAWLDEMIHMQIFNEM